MNTSFPFCTILASVEHQCFSSFRQKNDGRARLRSFLRQLGHLDLVRPAAFRPHLAMGLALSVNHVYVQVRRNEKWSDCMVEDAYFKNDAQLLSCQAEDRIFCVK